MSLLIGDTNIFIDLIDGELIPLVFRLPYEIAVPDILFEIELKEQHPFLLDKGLKIKSLYADSVRKVETLSVKYCRPSFLDHLSLALALQEKCPLLTGDKALRTAAKHEGVTVHGTLWILAQLLDRKLIDQEHATKSINTMKVRGSRLPWPEVEKMLSNQTTASN